MKIPYGKLIRQIDPDLVKEYRKAYQKFYRLNKSIDDNINPGRSAFLALTKPDSIYANTLNDSTDTTFVQKYTNNALRNFINTHSNEVVENKTMVQHMIDYNNGKISNSDLNRIIKLLKKSPRYIISGS